MDLKINRNKSYFIVDQYQKDTCFYVEDAYYHYDIDVDIISLFKQSKNKYFIKYYDVNKMEFVPLQLKINNFYYEIHDDGGYNKRIYIENSDDGFFETMREIWNKITKLMFIDKAPDFLKTIIYDDEEYLQANILRNTNFNKNSYYKDNIIIVLHSVINNNLKASLLELIKYEY